MADVLGHALDVAGHFFAVHLIHKGEDQVKAGCDLMRRRSASATVRRHARGRGFIYS